MSLQRLGLKALFLSADEAMGLLSLCITSYEEIDPNREQAILKLTEVVRQSIAEERDANFAIASVRLSKAAQRNIPTAIP